MQQPVFPLTVRYKTSEQSEIESTGDAELTIEWFDSDNPATVVDALGRPVRLRIEGLRSPASRFYIRVIGTDDGGVFAEGKTTANARVVAQGPLPVQ